MRVHVDEAGQAGVLAQVEHRQYGGRRGGPPRVRFDAGDASISDHDDHALVGRQDGAVDEPADVE